MKLRYLAPAVILSLALASLPALAQGRPGGGSRGGHGGGSHGGNRGTAVARHPSGGSRPGSYAPRGSVAQQRHPRAGTGSGYGYGGYHPGRGYYGGGHGHYRPYYGYGYRPYYPYYSPYYYPYYSSYWPGVALSFGWGYGSSWPYYSSNVVVGGDGGDTPPPPAREAERSYEGPSGRVRLEVRPDDASVYVDDEFRGTAREARIMKLSPGRHRIELVRPGFATEMREVTVVSGESQDVLVELLRP